ncbi:MAG: glycosyltransferase, partial [Collinsella sp.]|nr:glycosyltransferase [Collinsella sp.]
ADAITTVSPTYAGEIQTPEFGEGLDGVLRERSYALQGILNGIDVVGFDPSTDKRIAANYTVDDRAGKAVCKAKLQEELGLEIRDDRPLMVMVTRLTRQKGMDLVMYALDRILSGGVQVAVLGTGDRDYEDGLRYFQGKYPGTMAARIEFDPALSQRMYAAADMFLMPSKFEPCGLSQIIAMRYGTLPIVRETGGLKDTVQPYNEFTGEGTGFSFSHFNGDEMGDAVFRAARLFWDNRKAWDQLVTQAMSQDFSWTRSADKYLDLYFFMHPEIERPVAVEAAAAVEEPVAVEAAEAVEGPAAAEAEPAAPVKEPAAAEEPKAEEKPADDGEVKPTAKPAAKKTTTRKTTAKKATTTKAATSKTTAAKATTTRKRTTAAAKKAVEAEAAPEVKAEATAEATTAEAKTAAKAPAKTAAKKTTATKTATAKKATATKSPATKAATTKAAAKTAPKAAAKPAVKVEEAPSEPKAEAAVEAKPAAKTTTRKRATTTAKKATTKTAAPKAEAKAKDKPAVKAEPEPKAADVKTAPKATAKTEPAKKAPVSPAAPAEEKAPTKKTSVRKATATRKRR